MLADRLPAHVLVYGHSGVGKTKLAATAPLPGVILLFDGLGKAMPYLQEPHTFVNRRIEVPYNVNGVNTLVEVIYCYNPEDKERKHPQRAIYNLSEPSPLTNPRSWTVFYDILFPNIDSTMEKMGGQTLIIDSMTTVQNTFHALFTKYGVKSDQKEGNTWWPMNNALTDKLQWLFMMLAAKPYNTIVICHTEPTRLNILGYSKNIPNLAGRMGEKEGGVALSDNVWYVYVDNTTATHMMQCVNDGNHVANNNVNAPKTCENTWEAATKNAPTISWS